MLTKGRIIECRGSGEAESDARGIKIGSERSESDHHQVDENAEYERQRYLHQAALPECAAKQGELDEDEDGVHEERSRPERYRENETRDVRQARYLGSAEA